MARTLRALRSADYDQTLKEFKGLVAELTFATKSFFFLLLGYWTDLSQMVSVDAWLDRRRRAWRSSTCRACRS